MVTPSCQCKLRTQKSAFAQPHEALPPTIGLLSPLQRTKLNMGYLPNSPQRTSSPNHIRTMVVLRSGKAPALVMPAPNSPKARACNRPLADVLPGDNYNPFRRKLQPTPLRTLRADASTMARSMERPLAAFPVAQRLPVSSSSTLGSRSSATTSSSLRSTPSRSLSNSNSAPSTLPVSSPTKAERCVSKKVERSFSSPKKENGGATTATKNVSIPKAVSTTPASSKSRSLLTPKTSTKPQVQSTTEAPPSPGRRSGCCNYVHSTPPAVVSITVPPAKKSPSRRSKAVTNSSSSSDSVASTITTESQSLSKRIRSPTKTATTTKPSRKVRSQPQIPAPRLPVWDDTRTQDRLRIEELERKLNAIETSKARELEEIRAETSRQQQKLAKKVRSSAKNTVQQVDQQLEDNRRVVETLRAENEKIRVRNREIRANCTNLRTNNDRLEQTLKSNLDYHERLQEHQQRTELSHEKLQKMCKEYELQVEELQTEVDRETKRARDERFHRGLFEKLYLEVLPKLQKAGEAELCREMRESLKPLQSKDNGWTKSIHLAHGTGGSMSDTESESSESEAASVRYRY